MKNAFSKFNDAALMGVVQVQTAALARLERLDESGKLNRRVVGIASGAGALMVATGSAVAAGCDKNGATDKLISFITKAANFAIALGGVGALLMFAAGALYIIFGGSKEARVKQGMGMIKNAAIGIAVLAAGLFIRYIVVNFVVGATGGNKPGCLQDKQTGL